MNKKMMRGMIGLFGLIIAVVLVGGCSDHPGSVDTEYHITVTNADMVRVPGGNFLMGCTGVATPVHSVTLSDYYIAKYEVPYVLWYEVRVWAILHGYVFKNQGREGSDGPVGMSPASPDQVPVTCIDWRDCIAWCNAFSEALGLEPVYSNSGNTEVYRNSLTDGDIGPNNINIRNNGFRLPTEAEWEYAARFIDSASCIDGDKFSGYYQDTNPDHCGWYDQNYGSKVWPVALKKANTLGIYDMAGNVNEWCWDSYGDYPSSPASDPLGSDVLTNRVLRGGGGSSSFLCLRSSLRHDESPDSKGFYIGFRLARTTN